MTEKHLSSQFDSELNRVSARVMELGGLVESQIRQAVYALSRFSIEAVEQVAAAEKRVNAMEVEIDHELSSIIESGAARSLPTGDLRTAAEMASGLLRKTLDAFARLDTKAAVAILKEDDLIDQEFDGFVRKLITYMMEDPRTISASLDLLFLAKAIERIGDHSKNVAELIIYLVEGKDVRHQTMDAIESAVL
jgi:phosphate transport system protein